MSNSGRKSPRLVADKRTRTPKKAAKKKPAPKKKAAPKRKTRAKRKPITGGNMITRFFRRFFRWVFGLIWAITWRVTAVVTLVVGIAVALTYVTLEDADTLLDGRARGSVTLMDRYGEVFAWRGDQFGGVVTAQNVSRHLKNAVVATEDRRFKYHIGIDPIGIASAVKINLREGRGPLQGHGGSTLTQQTAKLLCFGSEYDEAEWDSEADYIADCRRTSLTRKAKEAIYAMAMEVAYTKDEILSIYLNRAYFGGGAYGAEAAAQRYFGKGAAQLTIGESAMLAGLLTAPSTFAPTNNLERSQNRASVVVGLMQDQGHISATDAATALASPAVLSDAAEAQAGGYFADWVMATAPQYFTRDTTEDVVIRTTLDPRLQQAAEDAVKLIFETKVREGSKAQAAVVIMSADGAVRAMVGGRKTKVSGAFNRATQAKRQTGSAFKPFVYATALELGESPNSTVVDEPYCLNIPGSGRWCPKNYNKKYAGRVSLTSALQHSLNVPAVKVAERSGLDLVRQVATDFGIESDLAAGPALALGASESTLLEMSGAYAGILNGGSSVTPYGLVDLRLQGDDEPLMTTEGGIGERVIREQAAKELIYMMNKVVTSGTGQRAKLPDREAAGKTGTTQAARDAWFVGFTADYVAGVWMGYDDNKPLSGVTGGGLPAEIWRETMVRVNEGVPAKPLPMIVPAPPKQVAQPTPRKNKKSRRKKRDSLIESVIKDIFGQ
ncbi:Penicillin-binding protein 2D [Roseovarius albus]|uniref:peptidoglycan glycosyltransferase n=1 Tax=Roseovarius albus TaxID=1247867 RepID=A0A1X6ZL45_9RHOB|nr:PBP1A family penicillin-binding protein [Roseovarius albus]SLN54309.1 Penicillin-binding protein 2D [Roseovarius albus]